MYWTTRNVKAGSQLTSPVKSPTAPVVLTSPLKHSRQPSVSSSQSKNCQAYGDRQRFNVQGYLQNNSNLSDAPGTTPSPRAGNVDWRTVQQHEPLLQHLWQPTEVHVDNASPQQPTQPSTVNNNNNKTQSMETQSFMTRDVALVELQVSNFALVEQQIIRFGPGMNTITGESGSGKSVLVEAMGQLLGGPAPAECVREPADCAVVKGTFWLSRAAAAAVRKVLQEEAVPSKALPRDADCALNIRREILRQEGGSRSSFRSRCYINDTPVTLKALKAMSGVLVDMNGQHSSLALREGHTQLALLDKVAGTAALSSRVNQLIKAMAEIEAKLEQLDQLSDPQERNSRKKLVDAVRRHKIQAGEEVALRAHLRTLEQARHMAEQCNAVRATLNGDGSGVAPGLVSGIRTLESQLISLLPVSASAKVGPAPGLARSRPAARVRGTTPLRGLSPSPASIPIHQASRTRDDHIDDDEDEHGVTTDGPAEELSPLEQALDALAAARQQLSLAESLVKTAARQSVLDMEEFQEKTERLALIDKLLRIQRLRTTQDLLESVDQAEKLLNEYEDMVSHQDEWEEELGRLSDELLDTCLVLSAKRRAAAPVLGQHVESCLAELAMGKSRVAVNVSWVKCSNPQRAKECEAVEVPADRAQLVNEAGGLVYEVRPTYGLDSVELRLAAGPAEPLRPLSAVASGGESARVMLALKAAPALATPSASSAAAARGLDRLGSVSASSVTDKDDDLQGEEVAGASSAAPTPVMILDELDSGIGSRLGAPIGAMLRRMAWPAGMHASGAVQAAAHGGQIICVTHLPQVAAFADHHVKVVKQTGDGMASNGVAEGRVTTRFELLTSFQDRAAEVAEMMGVDLPIAEDLLRSAQSEMPFTKAGARKDGNASRMISSSNNNNGVSHGVSNNAVAATWTAAPTSNVGEVSPQMDPAAGAAPAEHVQRVESIGDNGNSDGAAHTNALQQ